MDLVAHALHRNCADTRRNKGCHLLVAVHVLGQNLVGRKDVLVAGREIAVTEESLLGDDSLIDGQSGCRYRKNSVQQA